MSEGKKSVEQLLDEIEEKLRTEGENITAYKIDVHYFKIGSPPGRTIIKTQRKKAIDESVWDKEEGSQ